MNTVVLAPIPSARVRIAKKEKAGALLKPRNAYFVLRRRSESRLPLRLFDLVVGRCCHNGLISIPVEPACD